jgi:cardiolipin synthase
MDVEWLGKAGTFGLMCALPFFIGGHANDDWHSVAEVLAWVCAVPGLVFGWLAVATYIPKAAGEIREGRRERDLSQRRDGTADRGSAREAIG